MKAVRAEVACGASVSSPLGSRACTVTFARSSDRNIVSRACFTRKPQSASAELIVMSRPMKSSDLRRRATSRTASAARVMVSSTLTDCSRELVASSRVNTSSPSTSKESAEWVALPRGSKQDSTSVGIDGSQYQTLVTGMQRYSANAPSRP